MNNVIFRMLADLKSMKISTSQIEQNLKISNGLLGKAAKGTTKLSDDKLQKLIKYHSKNYLTRQADEPEKKAAVKKLTEEIPKLTTADKVKKKTSALDELMQHNSEYDWVLKIIVYCESLGKSPETLISEHMQLSKTKNQSKGKLSLKDDSKDKPAAGKKYSLFNVKMGVKE